MMRKRDCRFRLRLFSPTTAVAGILLAAWGGQALAALSITSATWDGRKLVVAGTDGRGGTVDVYYGYGTALLGQTSVKGSGSWKLQVNSNRNSPLDPVPCAVSATLAGDPPVENFPVSGAPADCAPQPPTVNRPPTCNIASPAAGAQFFLVNGTVIVSYDGTGTNDPDGDTLTYNWNFNGGASPSSSDQLVQDVTYTTEGTKQGVLTATDPDGLSCTANVSITVNQQPPQNDAPVCTIGGPADGATYTLVNGSVTVPFSATATDQNNDALSATATFADGTPSSAGPVTGTGSVSIVQDVAYTTAGAKTLSFDATETGTTPALNCSASVTINIQGPQPVPDVSINSTSQNCGQAGQPSCGVDAVTEQTAPDLRNSLNPSTGPDGPSGLTGYQIVAVNDLGMHCGDLDTRKASILPPFNVINSQVILKGGTPQLLGNGEVSVFYSAGSNLNDPVFGTTTPAELRAPAGSVFKTNFWSVARDAYDPFYPPGVLTAFYPNALNISDLSLPVPDVELFYLSGKDGYPQGTVLLDQQAMPAMTAFDTAATPIPNVPTNLASDPYFANVPQEVKLYVNTLPFFSTFAFGYTADVNWFSAEGVPVTTFDDFARYNSYPLMRVHAEAAVGNSLGETAGTKLATVDTVVPVSGEADCRNCHISDLDPNPPAGINSTVAGNISSTLSANGFTPVESDTDPQYGQVPTGVSVEWAADQNLLALHDINAGSQYTDAFGNPAQCDPSTNGWSDPNCLVNQTPIVCQTCHYTPALDLLQVGPKGPLAGPAAADGANGRQQTLNQSMSRVMHNFHGLLNAAGTGAGTAGNLLFPYMPGPDQTRDSAAILDQTCYQCHPGKNTKCLRGAMASGGVVCQDCHGQMTQVGDDFSKNVSPSTPNAFILADNFYTDPLTPRVPWANEPGCGSCHTGDASDNLASADWRDPRGPG